MELDTVQVKAPQANLSCDDEPKSHHDLYKQVVTGERYTTHKSTLLVVVYETTWSEKRLKMFRSDETCAYRELPEPNVPARLQLLDFAWPKNVSSRINVIQLKIGFAPIFHYFFKRTRCTANMPNVFINVQACIVHCGSKSEDLWITPNTTERLTKAKIHFSNALRLRRPNWICVQCERINLHNWLVIFRICVLCINNGCYSNYVSVSPMPSDRKRRKAENFTMVPRAWGDGATNRSGREILHFVLLTVSKPTPNTQKNRTE